VVKSLKWQVERKQRSTVDPWITFSKWGRPNLFLSLLLDCCLFPCHSSPGALQLALLSPLPICRNFMSISVAVICSRSGADCWVPLQFLLLFVVIILRESWERQVVRCVFCCCWIQIFFWKLEICVIHVCVFYLVVCVLKFEGEVHELKSLHHMFPIEYPCVISFALCARIRTFLAGVVSRIW
jgi:hypothetical protein